MNPSSTRLLSLAAVVIILIGFLSFMRTGVSAVQPKKDTYQAVFLANGQLYFGKLEVLPDAYVLKDIYYLQSNKIPLEGKKGETGEKIQLIKLGEELHGPEDTIYIERSHMLLWENLKPDSKIIQAIQRHKEKDTSLAPAPASAQ